MRKILIATKNPGKLKEFTGFLKDFDVVSLKNVGIEDDVDEDGQTFEENSQKKAKFYAEASGLPSLTDDGGLEIDALNGEPGVRSRRWLGYEASDIELKEHLRKVIQGLPEDKRTARFVTVLSFALPDGRIWSQRGEVSGVLSTENMSSDYEGYPYRSFFYVPEIDKFYQDDSKLTQDEIEKINHRFKALEKLLPTIKKYI